MAIADPVCKTSIPGSNPGGASILQKNPRRSLASVAGEPTFTLISFASRPVIRTATRLWDPV